MAPVFQGVGLQQVQHLDDVHAPGGGGRRGYYRIIPEAGGYGLSFNSLVAGEVGFGDQPTVGSHVGGDAGGRGAPVKTVPPVVRYAL